MIDELQNPETFVSLLEPDLEDLNTSERQRAGDLFFRLGQWWARRSVGWVLQEGQEPPEVAPWELWELLDVEFGSVLSSGELTAWKKQLQQASCSDPRLTRFQEGWQALMGDFASRIEEYRHVLSEFRQLELDEIRFAGVGPVEQILLETPHRLWVVATQKRSRHFAHQELQYALHDWTRQAKSGAMKQEVYEFERAHSLAQKETLQGESEGGTVDLAARLLQDLRYGREFAVYSLAENVVCYDRDGYHIFWLKEPDLD